jgi:hypothetical protein
MNPISDRQFRTPVFWFIMPLTVIRVHIRVFRCYETLPNLNEKRRFCRRLRGAVDAVPRPDIVELFEVVVDKLFVVKKSAGAVFLLDPKREFRRVDMGDGDFEALIRLSKGEWMIVCVVGVNSTGSSTSGRLFCDDLNGASDFCGNDDGGDEALILNVSIHLRSEYRTPAFCGLCCLVMLVVVARVVAHRWWDDGVVQKSTQLENPAVETNALGHF